MTSQLESRGAGGAKLSRKSRSNSMAVRRKGEAPLLYRFSFPQSDTERVQGGAHHSFLHGRVLFMISRAGSSDSARKITSPKVLSAVVRVRPASMTTPFAVRFFR